MPRSFCGLRRGPGRLITVAVPFVVVPIARKQVAIARRGAERFDQLIELARLLRMPSRGRGQQSALRRQHARRLAPDGEEAMLRLTSQPFPSAEFVLGPGQH